MFAVLDGSVLGVGFLAVVAQDVKVVVDDVATLLGHRHQYGQ